MERLKRMSVFAKVVEFGSFTAAARQLQMSVSSISQTVSKLEDELQVKLLNRSTRSIGLTEAGRIYCRLTALDDIMEKNKAQLGPVLANCIIESKKPLPPLVVKLFDGIKKDICHV